MPKQINEQLHRVSTMTDWIDKQFYSVVDDLINNTQIDMTESECSKEIVFQAMIVNSIKIAIRTSQS